MTHRDPDQDTGGRPGAGDEDRGRDAEVPVEIPASGWKDIVWRVRGEISRDSVSLIAAGVTFYVLLAIFPALAALVSVYGLAADPASIVDHVEALSAMLPRGGLEILQAELERLTSRESALTWGAALGLGLAFWSMNNAVLTLFQAMNVAYQEEEKRGTIALYALSFACTFGAFGLLVAFVLAVTVVPAVLAATGLPETFLSLSRWPILLTAAALALAVLYRFGPSRRAAKWRWISWGSALATLVWLGASFLFSWYLSNFADYEATYGSLGAVVGLMLWIWVSVFIVIVGAELNAEMEHQTKQDTTVPPERPIGWRGARMADTVGRSAEPKAR